MDPDELADLIEALEHADDALGDAQGLIRRWAHRLREDRGNPDEAELIRNHREASR